MSDSRLEPRVYEDLRERLVDQTRRNRLLHFQHSARAVMLRVVDEVPDLVLAKLQNDGKFRFRALPDLDDEPADERTPEFRAALTRALVIDEAYRAAISALDPDDASATAKEARIERDLRDRLRAELGLPVRPGRRNLDLNAHAVRNGINPSHELPAGAQKSEAKHRDEWLQTLLFRDQLKARVAGLARKAREVEQETGVMTLHLAFGFLEWFESDSSDSAFSSPLLLLPVGLERLRVPRGEEEFQLSSLDDAPVTNLSLEIRLRNDFGIALPSFDYERDPIESYLRDVAAATATLRRSRVRRYMTLAPFSFARIAMYRDLDPANWTALPGGGAAAHPLVRPLLRGGSETPAGESFAGEYDIDDPEVERVAPILVSDTDSSQHSAIVDVMKGRSLVIEGPPGTGKSQTIANLIANALAKGQRVLFVSEKMAALDVVKSRLEKVGLGHFCLAVHAAGAKPSAVIDALKARAALVAPRVPAGAAAAQEQAARARAELKAHLDAMHAAAGPLGETVHAYIGRLAELTRVLPRLPALLRSRAGDLPTSVQQGDIAVARERLEAVEAAVRSAEARSIVLAASPFRVVERPDLFPDERDALLLGIERLVDACRHQEDAGQRLRHSLSRPSAATSVSAMLGMAHEVEQISDPPAGVDRSLLRMLSTSVAIEDALWLVEQIEAVHEAAEHLRGVDVVDPSTLRIDAIRAAIEFAAPLGVAGLTVEQVLARAQEAEGQAEAWTSPSSVLAPLVEVLRLPSDPEAGTIRIACHAAQLAAAFDPSWRALCVPGLERHAEVLEVAAARQDAIEVRLREVSERFDLEGVSHTALRVTTGILRDAGFFSFFRSDVKEAKALFIRRWRGGPRPKSSEWVRELQAAADALAERDALDGDATLRDATSDYGRPSDVPLRKLARASKWLRDVTTALSHSTPESDHVRALLVSLSADDLVRLAALAVPAQKLRAFLDAQSPDIGTRWSTLRSRAANRAAALSALASGLRSTGLPRTLPIDAFEGIAAAYDRWRAGRAALSSDRARAVAPPNEVTSLALRETARFAQGVHERHQGLGLLLLQDGWGERIETLRGLAVAGRVAADATSRILGELAGLGMAGFVNSARQQDAAAVELAGSAMLDARKELSPYLDFAMARDACRVHALAAPVLAAFEDGNENLHHLPEALEWLVAWTLVKRHADSNRSAFTRTGDQLSGHRQAFAMSDRVRGPADATLVQRAVLARPVPHGMASGSRSTWTEDALLQNEFTKQRRHVPVRDLLNRAGAAVTALAPCLMMSPLTVAQYLKPGGLTFDLVVMDEASQIKPEDAIGAMLRGRQAVIVGDPKQLPPTNFFDRSLGGVDDEDEAAPEEGALRLSAEDRVAAESVLDLAMRAFRPARRLRWHYRSQHESLIAFSNREFYDDNLVVFPSAHGPSATLGIELVQVGGVWKNKINQEEVMAVAAAAADFMRRHPDLSLGIVAMNQPQREAIQAEIDAILASNAELADYVDRWEQQHEELFVKNLENVQGDERDVIFISLGWARTPEGALHQRFYPVNRHEDGHRRLNVLFTRAKRKIVLFSSLTAEDILVSDKTARGVRVFREYLGYARDGRLEQGKVGDGEADSPFETSVANALRALGHDVALQVGVAGYRIDIAVRHPDQPARFVLGIECDGATYHSAKSARDRDRLRQDALERLGWTLVRVWSTDWFRDPAAQAQRLSRAIVAAVAQADMDVQRRHRLVDVANDPEATAGPRSARRVAGRFGKATPVAAGPVAARDSEAKALTAQPELPRTGVPTGPKPGNSMTIAEALISFREEVIMIDLPGSEPGRSILRDAMIDAIVRTGLDDPADFLTKIPEPLRSRTDSRQVRYIPRICEIVGAYQEAAGGNLA